MACERVAVISGSGRDDVLAPPLNCVTITKVHHDWDRAKADANVRKHGITFEEAASVFADPLVFERADDRHFDRVNAIGRSDRGRLLFVVAIEQTNLIRIISARNATSHERKTYEEEV